MTEERPAYYISSSSNRGSFAMKIFIDAGRELNRQDNRNIQKYADLLEQAIREETLKNSPEAKQEAKTEKEEVLACFEGRDIFVEEIPNGYCSSYCCKHLPWFKVTTKKGPIIIGWRKRVISIDWSNTVDSKTSYDLFAAEDVTKDDKLIHAWGYDKAKEYINSILD